MTITTRFAPSPTGPLHLGHAFSALFAFDLAARHKGQFLVRIEDIDRSRARAHWETQIYEDLAWLGVAWPEPVMRQSERKDDYDAALDDLWRGGLLYPCSCTRADVAAALSAPQEGAHLTGPDGVIYPGTCRHSTDRKGPRPRDVALRLDMALAAKMMGPVSFEEHAAPHSLDPIAPGDLPHLIGDVVLARKDMGTSYHLSVVLDDAAQRITDVVRGADLFEATTVHVVLQRLLSLPTPRYHHHRLIRDGAGKRLAKRDDARAIETYRKAGATPQDIREMFDL